MQSVSDNIVMVYMTTQVNQEEISNNPPNLPYPIADPEHRKLVMDNAKHGAGQYDMYKDILQLSFLVKISGHTFNNKFMHLLYCESQEQEIHALDVPRIEVYNTKAGFSNAIQETLMSLVGGIAAGGYPMGPVPTMAGWKITSDIWPVLVNDSLAHKGTIPDWWKTDLTSRFNTTKGMVDVSNIYSQGVNMGMRRLPALSDALRYWGCGEEFDEPVDIAKTVCTDPMAVARKVEPYLTGMYEIVRRYNGN